MYSVLCNTERYANSRNFHPGGRLSRCKPDCDHYRLVDLDSPWIKGLKILSADDKAKTWIKKSIATDKDVTAK